MAVPSIYPSALAAIWYFEDPKIGKENVLSLNRPVILPVGMLLYKIRALTPFRVRPSMILPSARISASWDCAERKKRENTKTKRWFMVRG